MFSCNALVFGMTAAYYKYVRISTQNLVRQQMNTYDPSLGMVFVTILHIVKPKLFNIMNIGDKMSIRGTQTEKNLMRAFAGESQARNRYKFFAEVAHNEGYEKVATAFETIVRNEQAHALVFFNFLEGGMVEMTGSYPAGVVGSTLENLEAAAQGEYDEWSDLYPEFAQVAKDEGFISIALAFEYIIGIERMHEHKFRSLKTMMMEGQMFYREEPTHWLCSECGYVHNDMEAPESCPVCRKEQGFFESMDCQCGCECSCEISNSESN